MGLTYNGQDFFEQYGITVDSSDTWVTPERDRAFYHVPGRNGDLILDRGSWNNVEIVYHCHIDDNFDTQFPAFLEWLSTELGYAELVDLDNHPDVYRLAVPLFGIEPNTTFTNKTANFDVIFSCKPQVFINDGVNRIETLDFSEESAHAYFDWMWDGLALVSVFANNGARFEFGDGIATWDIKIAPFTGDRLVLDFETGDAIITDELGDFAANGNPYVTVTPPSVYSPDFPTSQYLSVIAYHEDPDDGTIYTGTVEIDPRYYRI